MSKAMCDDDDDVDRHPRRTRRLIGHDAAEQALLAACRSGRFPHAWLIGGPAGVGKATLAYRLARFLLANPDPTSPTVVSAGSLSVPPEHPAAKRLAAQAHPDLFTIEPVPDPDTGKAPSFVPAAQVRKIVQFFGSTPAEGGWRIAIVDTVENLNVQGANALLKLIEEPPSRSLILILSHAPGKVLPTIRSRCRRLLLSPLTTDEVAAALSGLPDVPADPSVLKTAAEAGEGSVGKAWRLLQSDGLKVREATLAQLAQLPRIDEGALHQLGDILTRNKESLPVFRDSIEIFLADHLRIEPTDPVRLARLSQVWDKVSRSGREVEIFNLERKPFVFLVFARLSEALRH